MLAVVGLMIPFVLVVLAIVVILILKNSRWWDGMCKKIGDTPNFEEPTTNDVIKKMEQTETALSDRAEERKEEAKALTQESDKIEDFLKSRNVKKDDEVKKEEGMPME